MTNWDDGGDMVGRDAFIAVYIYIMANELRGTIYVGVTSQLWKRAWEHREGIIPGFTKRYGCKRLVWYEHHQSMMAAIQREKSIKRYPRDWKLNLIDRDNPHWDDLFPSTLP